VHHTARKSNGNRFVVVTAFSLISLRFSLRR
jgi:hypothetical protein